MLLLLYIHFPLEVFFFWKTFMEIVLFHLCFVICHLIYQKYFFRTNTLQGFEDFPLYSFSNNMDPDVRLFWFIICGTAILLIYKY